MDLINYIQNSSIVKKYDIHDIKVFSKGFYIKLEVELINNTKLYIREYSDEKERNYSYHWQDKDQNIIIRWDNAPHYKEIITFPHHKHDKNKVYPNFDITIEDILKVIENELNKF
jgi:hypothetical protein